MLMLMSLALLAIASQEVKDPVPPEAALTQTEKTVREIFKDDYLKRSPAGQQALARKLIQQGIETKEDPTARYVLFREGAELATRAGDLTTLLQALNEILKAFQTTPVVVK